MTRRSESAAERVEEILHTTPDYDFARGENDDDQDFIRQATATIEKLTAPAEIPAEAIQDWLYEISNGDTQLGLTEWFAHRREADKETDGSR